MSELTIQELQHRLAGATGLDGLQDGHLLQIVKADGQPLDVEERNLLTALIAYTGTRHLEPAQYDDRYSPEANLISKVDLKSLKASLDGGGEPSTKFIRGFEDERPLTTEEVNTVLGADVSEWEDAQTIVRNRMQTYQMWEGIK